MPEKPENPDDHYLCRMFDRIKAKYTEDWKGPRNFYLDHVERPPGFWEGFRIKWREGQEKR